jgi:hypothetical protein
VGGHFHVQPRLHAHGQRRREPLGRGHFTPSRQAPSPPSPPGAARGLLHPRLCRPPPGNPTPNPKRTCALGRPPNTCEMVARARACYAVERSAANRGGRARGVRRQQGARRGASTSVRLTYNGACAQFEGSFGGGVGQCFAWNCPLPPQNRTFKPLVARERKVAPCWKCSASHPATLGYSRLLY